MDKDIRLILEKGLVSITSDLNKLKDIFNKSELEPRIMIDGALAEENFINSFSNVVILCMSRHDFQKEMYKIVIPFLEKELGEGYEVCFDKNYYPAELSIRCKGETLFYVNIREKDITKMNPFRADGLFQDLNYHESKLNSEKDKLKEKELINLKKLIEEKKETLKNRKDYEETELRRRMEEVIEYFNQYSYNVLQYS